MIGGEFMDWEKFKQDMDKKYQEKKHPKLAEVYEMLNFLRHIFENNGASSDHINIYDTEYFEFLCRIDDLIVWIKTIAEEQYTDIVTRLDIKRGKGKKKLLSELDEKEETEDE